MTGTQSTPGASVEGGKGDPLAETGSIDAARTISRRRVVPVNVLIAFTTGLAVIAIFAIWANRQLFNPDNWANTSTQLLQNPAIREATANYVVDQLYANLDVAGALRSGLPRQLQPLAGPAAGALRNVATQSAGAALSDPRVQSLWASANRAADQAFIAIVDGGTKTVQVNGGEVTLNLAGILDAVAARLGLPSGLGSKLPASAANLKIVRSDQLKLVQDVGNVIRKLALWLSILVPLLFGLAIFLARGRRQRTLMAVGFAIAFAGLAVLLGRSIMNSQLTNSLVKDASLRPAVSAAASIGTGILSEIAGAFVGFGGAVVIAAAFAGPNRVAVAARRAIAPFLRDHAAWTFGITTVAMVLVFLWQPIAATGKPVGMAVFLALALAGTAALRRETAAEFP